MNVKIVSVKREYIPLLLVLYPDYEYVTSGPANRKFIMEKEVADPATKNRINYLYNDCIIVSNKLFDELWDEEVLKQKAVEFARVRFKSRKRTLQTIATEGSPFVEEVKNFIFNPGVEDEENTESVLKLFDLYGSAAFSEYYLKLLESQPFPKIRASLVTFIQKVIIGESSIYYRKKNAVLGDKLKNNFYKAYSSYRERNGGSKELSFLKFLTDLLA